MKEAARAALGRALAWSSSKSDASIEAFVRQAACELHYMCRAEYASTAIVIKGDGSSWIIGKPHEVRVLPDELLQGFLLESAKTLVGCRVRDHALDTVRFVDAQFRTSIVAPLVIPQVVQPDSQAILWFGLHAGAMRGSVEHAREIAWSASEWLELYGPVLATLRGQARTVSELKNRMRRVTSLAHDIRAPLGALKYLIAEVEGYIDHTRKDWRQIGAELEYAEQLVATLSPQSVSTTALKKEASDAVEVLRRVSDRFQGEVEARGGGMRRRLPYESCEVRIPSLVLERVVSNLVGNAVRYSGGGIVSVDLEDRGDGSAVVRVSDAGPGIPREVLDALLLGGSSSKAVPGAHGWGVGLLSCREMVEEFGGRLHVLSSEQGTDVEVVLVRASERNVVRRNEVQLRDSAEHQQYSDSTRSVLLVDDDAGHSASLARVLARRGIHVWELSSVDQALKRVSEDQAQRFVIVCDAHMPDGGAARLLEALGQRGEGPLVAVMSGDDSDEAHYRFAALGAREFFSKPLNMDRLVRWVREEVVDLSVQDRQECKALDFE